MVTQLTGRLTWPANDAVLSHLAVPAQRCSGHALASNDIIDTRRRNVELQTAWPRARHPRFRCLHQTQTRSRNSYSVCALCDRGQEWEFVGGISGRMYILGD